MARYFIFDKFNTWYDWGFILTGKDIPDAEPNVNYVKLDGADGTLDLSESLTGHVTYQDRTISAAFWTDQGTYSDREKLIRDIVRELHGHKIKIVEPDDPEHYFYGRFVVTSKRNIIPFAEIEVEMICEPWRYSQNETTRRIDVTNQSGFDVVLMNHGAKVLTPLVTVSGNINISYGDTDLILSEGVYQISDLRLTHGVNVVNVSGDGYVIFTYREADL